MYFQQRPACPIEKLPAVFHEAVTHVCQMVGVPPEVVVADAFAVTSTVTQRRYKIKGIHENLMPTTLNTLSLAPTAIGKGESYRKFFQSPADFETNALKQSAHRPTIDDLLLQDVSLSSLMSHLDGYGKSASIQLEDGFSFLGGPLMKRDAISKLPQAWSGPPSLKFGRCHSSKNAIEPCLAIGLRIQPELFYAFLKRDKGESRHLGLWPRFMTFCYDPQRFPVTPWHVTTTSSMTSHLPLIERLVALSADGDPPAGSNEPARKVLMMDTYANAHLREIAYWVKGQMTGEFYDIQDAAGRAAENTLRLASNFHVVCHGEGPISREMIERAWSFVDWSLTQFRNVFVHALQPPPKTVKLAPMKPPKLPHHQKTLNTDMQFMLDCVGARGHQFPMGRVPVAEIALLTGFHKTRFLKTLGWLIAGCFVEVAGDEKGFIRLLPLQHLNTPYGYAPIALPSGQL